MPEDARTALILDARFERHDTGPGHPERPRRITAISDYLNAGGLTARGLRVEPQPIERRWLLTNHAESYLERLRMACAEGRTHIDCADSAICPATFEVAELAAGAVLQAVDAVADGRARNAFCAVRPPGHHAEHAESMGFCMFNNVAIAARYLLAARGLQRLAIVDWDVHHGNGTQHAFEHDPRVLFVSIHGHPDVVYPGTGYAHERGRGAGEGFTLNVPMAPGSGDAEYRAAFRESIEPALEAHAPEFLLVSAGFDAHRADPLAPLELDTDSFAWMTGTLLRVARRHCHGRLVSVLEGGYDLQALAESVGVHVAGLMAD